MSPTRPGARWALAAPAALVLLVLQACSLDLIGAGTDRGGNLREASERWARQAIRDYRYTVARTCFCGPDVTGPVRVEVRDGRTVSVTPVDPGRPVRAGVFDGMDTVEDLFRTIEDAIARDPYRLVADYHPELGYPVSVYVDYERTTVDEESGFRVESFERIP